MSFYFYRFSNEKYCVKNTTEWQSQGLMAILKAKGDTFLE